MCVCVSVCVCLYVYVSMCMYTGTFSYLFIHTYCTRKKLDQNEMTINFGFIIDILIMNWTFYFSRVLIISLLNMFTNRKRFRYLLPSKWIN